MASSHATDTPTSLEAAVARIREQTDMVPEVALILGSGLGALADTLDDPHRIDTSDVPGYPQSTVEGHSGDLVFGHLEERPVVFVRGRVHLYEGHPVGRITYPVRLVHALGARRLLVTNAAGGINPECVPGTLMFIVDHINMTGQRPPGLAVAPGDESSRASRFGVSPYDRDWLARAERIALDQGVATRRGCYLWTLGPSYETKAEIQAFSRLGADAVGMSTVPEVLQAHALGMSILGISTITNPAAGLSPVPLSHEEVLEVGGQVRADLSRLVRGIVRAG